MTLIRERWRDLGMAFAKQWDSVGSIKKIKKVRKSLQKTNDKNGLS